MPEKKKSPDAVKLGNRLRDLRIKAGHHSLERFAYEHNLSRVLYSNYENGWGNITYKNLVKVAKALKVSLTKLFEGID